MKKEKIYDEIRKDFSATYYIKNGHVEAVINDERYCENCYYCSDDGIDCDYVGPCNDRESWLPIGESKGDVFDDVKRELVRAGHKYSSQFHDVYQALGAITCEYHELLDEIKTHGTPDRVRAEAVQVAAMAIKLVEYLDGKHE